MGEGVLGLRVLSGGGAMKAPLVRGIQVSQLALDGGMGCEGVGSYRLSTAPQSHPPGENRSVCRRLLRSRADHTKTQNDGLPHGRLWIHGPACAMSGFPAGMVRINRLP